MYIYIIAIIILLAFFSIIYILLYNKLQSIILRINESEKRIDDSLRTKYDLINHTFEAIKKDMKDLIDVKDENLSSFELSRLLKEYEIKALTFKEDKKIQKNEIYSKNTKDLESLNITLNSQIKYYDDNIIKYNKLVKKFPTNIICKLTKNKKRNFFDNKDLEDNIIKDFKL